MSRLIAVPNVSEGRDGLIIDGCVEAIGSAGASLLDRHTDPIHDRTVFTVAGQTEALTESMVRLAVACAHLDLTGYAGVHPRLGGLDVCPFVPHAGTMEEAVAAARSTGRTIYERTGIPVYLYGHASHRDGTRELRDLRRGGLDALMRRATECPPDHGTGQEIRPEHGVICVGARGVLIAFNVWLRSDPATARLIAASVREGGERGGLPGVRALGLPMSEGMCQISMNIVDPDRTSIEEASAAVTQHARELDVEVVRTELVGLVPERYLPPPNAAAAQLLSEPGRSLEAALLER